MVGLITRLQEGLAKARIERALVKKSFPRFVSDNRKDVEGIPVFCFHSVTASDFESALLHLKNNQYKTLSADELVDCIGGQLAFDKHVVLTFDDGWRSTWTVAYPLLKKYGFSAIGFLVPTWMNEDAPSHTLEDCWSGRMTPQQLDQLELEQPYLSWSEAEVMLNSRVFEFQSHSLTHDTVFTSGDVVDFVNPAFRRVPHKIPLVNGVSVDPWKRSQALGMPLYTVAPRLTGATRYLDDEQVRQECMSFVQQHGGGDFFTDANWKQKLLQLVDAAPQMRRFETTSQTEAAIRHELQESRRVIEERLGTPVKHFCFPFYAGSETASSISEELGYVSNYWGWIPASDERTSHYGRSHLYTALDDTDYSTGDLLQNRRTNTAGDDPFRIVRVPGDYIHRLPGRGRRTLTSMFVRKAMRNLK